MKEADKSIVLNDDRLNDSRWDDLTFYIDEHKRIWTYDKDGKAICGAKTRSGSPCKVSPMTSKNRCRKHGGKSPLGAQHPRAKHLRYSRDIVGKELLTRYQQAMHDPELMDLRHDIALTEARIADLLQGLETGESLRAWKRMKTVYDDFVTANNKGATADAVLAIQEMGRLIRFGIDQHAKWKEIQESQVHKRKLTETEHKRQSDMKQMMTTEQAKNLMIFTINVVKRRILQFFPDEKGQELMATISQDISREMSQRQKRRPDNSPEDED